MLTQLERYIQQRFTPEVQERYQAKTRQLRQDFERAFTEHPEATGETYVEHLIFTVKMSLRFLMTSTVIMVHGIFPFFFTRTASLQIEQIYRIMKSRIPVQRRQEIDREALKHLTFPVTQAKGVHLAIVGGGFTGAMVLANVIRQSSGGFSVAIYESGEALGTGVAYSTEEPLHLLNVRADRMGAFAEDIGGFYAWLNTEDGRTLANLIWPGHAITPDCFVPRALYAKYLRYIVQQSLMMAKEKNITVQVQHESHVTDATLLDPQTQQIQLTVEKNGVPHLVTANAVVLATGNLPPRSFSFQSGLINSRAHYIENVWQVDKDHVFHSRVQELSADSEIVIIGTGLTMVDIVLSLKARGYKGTITALSRHGLLPLVHTHGKAYPAWEWVSTPESAPRTALGLLMGIRRQVQIAAAEGYDWRSVLDSLRPVTQTLWKQLSIPEKRRFMGKLFTLWNIHRHRMAPDVFAEMKALQQGGMVKILPAKIYYVGSDTDGLTVAYRKRGTNRMETLRPTLLLNCIGPEYDIAVSNHSLLRNLRDKEMVTVGPLRIGIETTETGTSKGTASESLFPLGTLLVGELLECTAVPELREQASRITERILTRISLDLNQHQAQLVMGEHI